MIARWVRRFIQGHCPRTVKAIRWAMARHDALAPTRSTYSQFGEDRIVVNLLRDYDLSTGIYVDVGANQPTKISNTYLFYRLGCRGVAIEPNSDLISLFKKFRPRDIPIHAGCGDRCTVLEFKHSKASVFSTFSDTVIEGISRSEYLPILRLDDILANIPYQWIFYLSIDTEGFDLPVLSGATRTLEKTLFVTVEYKSAEVQIRQFMRDAGFELVIKTEENFIFKNRQDFPAFRTGS